MCIVSRLAGIASKLPHGGTTRRERLVLVSSARPCPGNQRRAEDEEAAPFERSGWLD